LKSKTENLKLLMGMPEKTAWGGINACEPPFVEALKNLGVSVTEETYIFDHKARQTKPYQRVGNVLKTARRFRKLLQEGDFDVLHLNTAFDLKALLRDVATVSLIKNRRTKIFLKMHGSEKELLETRNAAKRIMRQRLFAKVDGIGVLSSEEKENFARAGVEAKKIFVVKNAVRVPENLPLREFDSKPPQIVFASRLISTKGLLETIHAIEILKNKGLIVHLHCLGDGEVRNFAEGVVELWELKDQVHFYGYVSEAEVNEFYLKSDLLAFPTFHAEGFPMVIFNALAHSLPIVTTKIRAAADYLREPDNVLWTEAKNAAQLAEKIGELIENENLRRRMSENNRKLAANFTAERIAPEYLEIYQKIIGRS
jgi:glycosyltransferase involved in cell wall biosynthesis